MCPLPHPKFLSEAQQAGDLHGISLESRTIPEFLEILKTKLVFGLGNVEFTANPKALTA
jgi:hypothetical protein